MSCVQVVQMQRCMRDEDREHGSAVEEQVSEETLHTPVLHVLGFDFLGFPPRSCYSVLVSELPR